jgi:hypothetical protein
VPALLTAARHANPAAESTLLKLGKNAVPGLTEALSHKDEEQRNTAANILAKIGPDAKGAVGALTAALKDRSRLVRESAALALESIKGSDPKSPREVGYRDFSGVWSGPLIMDKARAENKCMMFLNLGDRGEGTVSITGSGNTDIDGRYNVMLREIKNGKATFKDDKGFLQNPKDGKISAIWKPPGKIELQFELSRQK